MSRCFNKCFFLEIILYHTKSKIKILLLTQVLRQNSKNITSTCTDLILFVAVAADFHVRELGDEVDVLLAVGAVEALVGARLGVQHRLDEAGVRADLQRGERSYWTQ